MTTKAKQISPEHLAERQELLGQIQEFAQQASQLEQALAQNREAQLVYRGRFEQWREGINRCYGMTGHGALGEDQINDEGEIVRASSNGTGPVENVEVIA